MQLQKKKAQLQHTLSDVARDFASKAEWVALYGEDCTKTFQACTCFYSERLAEVMISGYGCTGNFFPNSIKCLSMFRCPYK